MFSSCLEKQQQIVENFKECTSSQQTYQKVIEWGKKLSAFDSEWGKEENLVSGCQSVMYLHSTFKNEVLQFHASSDALISAGLAAMLITVYSGETPEAILKCEPKFLEEIGLSSSLTPGRMNGLLSLYLKMKQEAVKCLLPQAH